MGAIITTNTVDERIGFAPDLGSLTSQFFEKDMRVVGYF